jgi:hypothetical protein
LRGDNWLGANYGVILPITEVLRRNSEGVSHAVEKSEESCDVNAFGDLVFRPAGIAKFLHILWGGARSVLGDELNVVEQSPLGGRKAGVIELAFENRFHTLIGGSLNTQEVSMAVQSIWTPVQVRDVAGDHLFMASREMAFREMDRVREVDHLAKKAGRAPKHLMMPGT